MSPRAAEGAVAARVLLCGHALAPCEPRAVEAGARMRREVSAAAGVAALSGDRGRVRCRPAGTCPEAGTRVRSPVCARQQAADLPGTSSRA